MTTAASAAPRKAARARLKLKTCRPLFLAAALLLAVAAATRLDASHAMQSGPPVPTVVTVRHAPVLNGRVEGSVQVLTGEYVNLNSGSVIKGDLLVPGTPRVQLNGAPLYQGTVDGVGGVQPSNYQITLNSGSEVRYVRRRTDPVALAPVPLPPAATGTRNVVVNSPGQSVGNWATVRDLTLNSNVGSYSVPPGTYNRFTANGGGGFILGVAGAAQPSVYNFEDVTLNSNSSLQVIGPVVVNVGSRVTVNGGCVVGSAAKPHWLSLNISKYDLTANGNCEINGAVRAPSGAVTLSGGGRLRGSVACDRLTLNASTIFGVVADTTPPVLTVTQPAQGALLNASSVNVTGTFTDASATTVTVNGAAATLSGNSFSATVALGEGPNTLLVAATDAAGNRSEVTRAVTRDTTAPLLTVEQPADGLVTKNTQVTVTGTYSDASATTVKVNNVAATLSGNHFSASVPVSEGANTLTVNATDGAGNQNNASVTLTRDTAPPVIGVTEPTEQSVTGQQTLDVFGVVTDATQVVMTANGVALVVDAEGFFAGKLPLTEGASQIRLVATDAAGNSSEATVNVRLDTTPPVVSELSPAQGSDVDVTTPSVTLAGRVTDASSVAVTVEGVTVNAAAGGTFSIPDVPVVVGENVIRIVAVDAAGNESTTNLTFVGKDLTAPSAPTLFQTISPTRLQFQTIQGHAEPGSRVVITGGAEPTEAVADAAPGIGLFAIPLRLAAGVNELTIISRDAAGNSSTPLRVSITSDPAAPPPPAGTPAQINTATGNAQRGLTQTELPRPLIAIVTDSTGSPVGGVSVRFEVVEGNGHFVGAGSPATLEVQTDAHGYARARYVGGANAGIQLIRTDFTGNMSTPAIFTAEALTASAGRATTVSGVVLDQNMRALPNVLVRLGGQQTRTSSAGSFTLTNVASGPHQVLELIGRDQITLPGRWPNISYDFDVLPEVDNRLGRPLFLPRVNDGIALPLDAGNVVTADTVFELPVVGGEPPVRVVARAGTRVQFPPDVTDKRLSVTRIANNRVPMALEDGLATNLYISVQPSGALFDQPLEVSFPNLDRLPGGNEVLLMSFDHDAGRYVRVGTGHVSQDGKTVKSDSGSGIRVGAWHAAPPDDPQPEVTVLSHIKVKDNPAFEGLELYNADVFVLGTRGVRTSPAVASADDPSWMFTATVALSPGTSAIPANVEGRADARPADVVISRPPDNPNPSDNQFGSNFSFLSNTRIDAAVSDDQPNIRWTVTPNRGTIRNPEPANRQGPTFSFTPSPPAHPAYCKGCGGSRDRSTALSYAIKADLLGYVEDTNTITQDQLDIIRQEYLNHGIDIPARNEFTFPQATRNFSIDAIRTTAYSVVLGEPGLLAQQVRDAYNRLLRDDEQAQVPGTINLRPTDVVVRPGAAIQVIGALLDTEPCYPNPRGSCDDRVSGNTIVAGPNGIAETLARNEVTDFDIELNSTWRNPERNERVTGALRSRHQYGNAIDMDLFNEVSNVPGKTTAQLFCILQTAADSVAGVNGFAEHLSTQVPCNSATVTHVHAQR